MTEATKWAAIGMSVGAALMAVALTLWAFWGDWR